MKRSRIILALLAVMMIAMLLTGCLEVEMKINANGSCQLTYVIDMKAIEELGGGSLGDEYSPEQMEESFKESIEAMNDEAGKKIASLKSYKYDKGKKKITAVMTISDINKMGDGAFFGTVKEFKKDNEAALDNLIGKNKKSVDADKVDNKLSVAYLPMGGEELSMAVVTMIVPGTIEYVADGGDIEKNNTAVFESGNALVVFKKGGGGFPVWLLILVALVLIGFFLMKKKPATTTAYAPAPQPAPVQPSVSPVSNVPAAEPVQTAEPVVTDDNPNT